MFKSDEIEAAKTILCFMLTSLSKKWSSVVRLFPLTNSKAKDLLPLTPQIICDIEMCGLIIDAIVSDKYPLNVNLFKLLGNNTDLLPCVPHPNASGRSLYLVFDFVHIIKSIRNIWVNQKDDDSIFFCPKFEDISNSTHSVRLVEASFQIFFIIMILHLHFLFQSLKFKI
ncbi:Transposable element P transposase [Oopsacas minuta]|uniref:Transposable element P transposase n=1 Tax=Oopsacas minuta TaxID=111878 RepID=A0AAV7K316_9METZ|nr:Transposable element P transposase [Oopsacas minuta]